MQSRRREAGPGRGSFPRRARRGSAPSWWSARSCRDLRGSGLAAMQLGIASAPFQQLVMTARFDDAAAFDRDDPVAVAHRGQAVGGYEHGAPAGDRLQIVADDLLAF